MCAMLLTALPQLSLKVDEPVEMLPKSRKALSIQEIAALARSSLNGISQVVRDHVTKPTAMAQGRVAHLIEWKGWSKPLEPSSATLQSHFNSYSHLSEGEQEARFAAGVAEQFAIAEAKLRAWNSVDEEDEEEDCSEEELAHSNELTVTTQSSDAVLSNQESSTSCQPETNQNISEESSLILSYSDGHRNAEEPQGTIEELQIQAEDLQLPSDEVQKLKRRSLWSRGDSCYHSASYSESGLSPEEEEEEEQDVETEDNVFQEVICWYSMSDTSGAASFDDEVDVEDGETSRQ
ncbi:protein FAM131A [Pangasianodon hypophthalmus]|uniref:protein FAM131A n=1 Tax=Pangasianodon hypophthalmus TaxID=310915 RepID=UPI0023072247|nr:protein FAM131A [Pangasianodon hypophthalmus]